MGSVALDGWDVTSILV